MSHLTLTQLREEISNLKPQFSKVSLVHHKLSSLNAESSEEDYQSVATSIKENGFDIENKAILVTSDLQILDGRHRQRALLELGLEVPYLQLQ